MNISDIAKLAGVSRATVSRYLNDGYVSEEKREAIKKVIAETGYVPSTQAQMLRTRRTKLIGVILPKLSSESISKIVDGISITLGTTDYHIIVANTDNNVERELEYLNIFKENQVDGIIFLATIIGSQHKKLLKKLTVPIVIVGQELDGYCCVYHDDAKAAQEVTTQMIQRGCKALVYIGATSKDEAAGLHRKEGYLEAIEQQSEQCISVAVKEGDFSFESGYELMQAVLKEGQPIDGVFCGTDTIAAGVVEAVKEANKRIPEDVSIVGIGDSRLGYLMTPKLTSVRYYYETSGKEAAQMLLELINHKGEYQKKIKLGYKIIERGSVK